MGDVSGDKVVTEGQLAIMEAIIFRQHKRVQILCSTQYGKSLWVAISCIILACVYGIKVAIIAPSDAKAKIIMRYFIEHLGDNLLFYGRLDKKSRLERLRQEESKERITLNNGGGIYIISAQQRNANKSIEAAMGEGAEIVIGDEFGLIQDATEATIFRMIAGKGRNAVYVKIGNPFYAMPPYSHFFATWNDPNYHRIFIDYERAICEGRYTKEFIEESRTKPLFDVLYACEFPDEDVMDGEGYRPLVTTKHIKFGITPEQLKAIIQHDFDNGGLKHKPKGGADIGGGKDRNVYTVRYGMLACVISENRSSDTMTNVVAVEDVAKDYHIAPEDFAVDDIGVGHGVRDRLRERGFDCNGVAVGEAAWDPETFYNLKAELCWDARLWLMNPESRLDQRPEWVQLTWLRYKTQSDRRIIMEPKEKLKGRVKQSPDHAESFYLTFAKRPFLGVA